MLDHSKGNIGLTISVFNRKVRFPGEGINIEIGVGKFKLAWDLGEIQNLPVFLQNGPHFVILRRQLGGRDRGGRRFLPLLRELPKAERLRRPPGHRPEHIPSGGLSRRHRAEQADGHQGGGQTAPQQTPPPGRTLPARFPLRFFRRALLLDPVLHPPGGVLCAGVGRDRGRPLQRLQAGPEGRRIIGLLRHVVQRPLHGVGQPGGGHGV